MTEQIFLVDMGNTRLKWVSARDGKLLESTFGRGSAADCYQAIRSQVPAPARVLVSSVASEEATADFFALCENRPGWPVRRLSSQQNLAGIVNGYEDPLALGIDRWLAIAGAAHAYGMPIVVMDLGTATTLDAVDEQGRHLGGLILPGPALMLKSLATATAMRVPPDFTRAPGESRKSNERGVGPADTTFSAIQDGVFAAQIGALNQFMRHVSAKLEGEPKLVVTGGAAEGILGRLENEPVFDPWLVFKGMLHYQE